MTTTDVQNWINAENGKWHDFDGYYGAQCTDLAQFYSRFLGGHRFSGNAINFYDQPGSFYTQIANSPDPNNVPQLGDIVVWSIGSYGHVAICISADANGLTTLDQNWYTANDTGSVAVVVRHDWTSRKVKGWLRPKNLTTLSQGGELMWKDIADARAKIAHIYRIIRGQDPSEGEIDSHLPGSPLSTIFGFEAEANQARVARNEAVASRDSQIAILNKQLTDVQTALANEKNRPPEVVVKEVEKIVEKTVEVIKEVPVYTHDEETKANVSAILKLLKSVWGSLTSLHKKVKK